MKRLLIKFSPAHARQVSFKWKPLILNTSKMLGILAVTIIVTELLRRLGMNRQSLLMIYILSVLAVAYVTPRYGYGMISALVSTFVCDFLITEPRLDFSFTIGLPITLFTMLTVTFLTSTLTIQLKSQAHIALRRGQRAETLSEITQALMSARDVVSIAETATQCLYKHLELTTAFFPCDPEACEGECAIVGKGPDCGDFLTGAEKSRVHRVFQGGAPDGEDSPIHYQAVMLWDNVFGVMGVKRGREPLSPGNLTFIQTLVRQMALALELQSLSDAQSDLRVKAEKEKMRSTLLRSISHDLRTPLTSIMGASTAVLEQRDMPENTRDSLLEDIRENAQWLIRMVENILTVTRISRESMEVQKTMEAAEEVISQAVSIVRSRSPDCNINVRIPDELLLVPMDPTLISQVLINLLENAVKNSPANSTVLVSLKKQGSHARFEVLDHGRGIPEHLLSNLFEIHTSEGPVFDSTRGIGIGLSICQTIVQAHGGDIEGCNRQEGGASFAFRIPLEEADCE